MKRLMLISALTFFAVCSVHSQTKTFSVKSTPAEQALESLAKQSAAAQTAVNAMLEQAKKDLAAKNQPLLDQIKAKAAKWQAKIDADTKDLRAQVDANNKAADAEFQKKVAGLQVQLVDPKTITTLEDVVKKEQGLPADATFDTQTQQWTEPKKP